MMRGVRLDIPQSERHALLKVLQCIDIGSYDWYYDNCQTEVWAGADGRFFFEKERYPGVEFQRLIRKEHSIVFLKIQAYFPECTPLNLHTFDEFARSECQILLLAYDCEHIEIYSQRPEIAKALIACAHREKFQNIEYITSENDSRTKLDVL